MHISVVGAGYVGLVSAAGFAEIGNDVICVDVDEDRVRALRQGEQVIVEPGLSELVRRNQAAGRLSFTTLLEEALPSAEAIFVAVGTPSRTDGGADLSAVLAVADEVGRCVREPTMLVLKSTVPVGSNARVNRIVANAAAKVSVVSNPEFLKEGEAVYDFLHPDRIVIGCRDGDTDAKRRMAQLYKPLNLDRDRMLWMRPESAELTKYVANTMLAMRISFMNEVAGLCESVGAHVSEVREGVGSDSRIGPKFLYAGPGYGGSCFPKDVRALIDTARQHGVELDLATATNRVNDRQKGLLLRKLRRYFDGELRHRHLAIWGVTFKPRTDDVRESPALTLIEGLLSEGAKVTIHDPEGLPRLRAHFSDRVLFAPDAYAAAEGADALILTTEWREYQSPDFRRLAGIMRGNLLLDGRNVWSSYALEQLGFIYEGIGVRRS